MDETKIINLVKYFDMNNYSHFKQTSILNFEILVLKTFQKAYKEQNMLKFWGHGHDSHLIFEGETEVLDLDDHTILEKNIALDKTRTIKLHQNWN